jgi:CheY-like chemotaxis protein
MKISCLIVDDVKLNRQAMQDLISEFDYLEEAAECGNSAEAMTLLSELEPDVMFLDIEMPGMDGFELCSKIHETEANRTTPIVFVTSHSDFDSRAKSALSGARDLMAKPFLAFEITLKALTLVLKTRLQAGIQDPAISEREKNAVAISARDSASHTAANPVELALPSSNPKIDASAKSNPNANLPQLGPLAHVASASSDANGAPQVVKVAAPPMKVRQPHPAEQERSALEFAKAFYTQAPAHLQILGQQLAAVQEAALPAERNELLAELFIGVHTVCSEADRAHLGAAFRVSFALEAMLKKLLDRPKLCSASCLQTAAAGLEALEDLCHSGADLDLTNPPVKLLVVDDDPLSRRLAPILQTMRPTGAAVFCSRATRTGLTPRLSQFVMD